LSAWWCSVLGGRAAGAVAESRVPLPYATCRDAEPTNGFVLVSSPEGRDLANVASSVEALLGHHLVDDRSLLIFHVSAGSARVLDLDPASRAVRSDGLLSPGD
jgi:hypothetical protein